MDDDLVKPAAPRPRPITAATLAPKLSLDAWAVLAALLAAALIWMGLINRIPW